MEIPHKNPQDIFVEAESTVKYDSASACCSFYAQVETISSEIDVTTMNTRNTRNVWTLWNGII